MQSKFMPELAINDRLDWQERGLHYGDGLFETLLKLNGEIPLWEDHYRRLKKGCERLRIGLADEKWLVQKIVQETKGQNSAIVKIIVTRGRGGRGLELPARNQPSIFVLKYPYRAIKRENLALGVSICQTRLPINRNLAGIKHLNRLDYVLAAIEIEALENKDEAILCDTDGFIVEGIVSNLFFYLHGQMYTPSLELAGVEGIMRQRVLKQLQHASIAVEEGRFTAQLLLQSSECFMCNSVHGVRPIHTIDRQHFVTGPVTQMLMSRLNPVPGSHPGSVN